MTNRDTRLRYDTNFINKDDLKLKSNPLKKQLVLITKM